MRTNTELDYDGVPLADGHHLATEVTIGTIIFTDDEEYIEESEIVSNKGRFKPSGLGECKIEVYNGEGDVPHFHLYSLDKSFECCICIHSPHYFAHGGKYKDKLNSKQCKQLDDWLEYQNKNFQLSNWEVLKGFWENMNPLCKFPENRKVDKKPCYRNMTDYKSR